MKNIVLFVCLILFLPSYSNANKSSIKYIRPGNYQLIFPGQIITINFENCPIPSYEKFIKSADLDEKEQEGIVKIIKEQLDQLPTDFIRNYLPVNIYPFHIMDDRDFGFYFNNEIVIAIDKIKPGHSFIESISSTLMEQVGAIAFLSHPQDTRTSEIKSYFRSFNFDHPFNRESTNIFDNGYVCIESAVIDNKTYHVNNEMRAFFSFLMVQNTRSKLEAYIHLNPNSPLAQKTERFVDYLSLLSLQFSMDFFFQGTVKQQEYPMDIRNDSDGEQLLSLHELKSYELYNFPHDSKVVDYETSSFEEQYVMTSEVKINDTHIKQEFDEIETIFDNNQKEPSNKETQKKKKKKGTGWMILGIVLITLQLLNE